MLPNTLTLLLSNPPNLEGKENSFLSTFEQFMPPDIAGIKTAVIISSTDMDNIFETNSSFHVK